MVPECISRKHLLVSFSLGMIEGIPAPNSPCPPDHPKKRMRWNTASALDMSDAEASGMRVRVRVWVKHRVRVKDRVKFRVQVRVRVR